MPWRKWNVIIVLILANYVVFGLLATFVFPVKAPAPLIHTPQPTFTPGIRPLQRVGTLSYDFLTPSPRATNTSASTVIPTVTPTPPDATVSATAPATLAPQPLFTTTPSP